MLPGSAVGKAIEAKRAATLFTNTTVIQGPRLKSFQDGFLPFVGAGVKAIFAQLKREISPNLGFRRNRNDAHQDHCLLGGWNTFGDHLILEYEIPKYDGDLGRPNLFVPFKSEICESNVSYILEAFPSQHCKKWFVKIYLWVFFAPPRNGMQCPQRRGSV